jgi:hypothetical protein
VPRVREATARRRALMAMVLVALAGAMISCTALASTSPSTSTSASKPAGRFQIRHVYVIVLENESAATTFGAASPAPYLSKQLTAQGAFLPNYYGVGHSSLDNYIAMISGQAPNEQTRADCGVFANFASGPLGSFGQEPGTGCVYPTDVPTVAAQLTGVGDTWRDYNQGMGANPARESATCGHPAVGSPDATEAATATDMYATRHDPFVYFHGIIDNATLCNSHVVNLSLLPQDLSRAARTADFTFITPDLCNDGHDAPCADGEPGGLAQADSFLKTWVPKITASQGFREDGLLIVTFDEAAPSDASSCCGEIPGPGAAQPGGTGPGGGRVGAVLLSPCIAPGTVSQTPYDHYTMLGSVENIFGLSHLGYAGLPHSTYFGTDIYKRPCGPAPPTIRAGSGRIGRAGAPNRLRITLGWKVSTKGGTPLAYSELQEREHGTWHTVLERTHRTSYSFIGRTDVSYQFRIRAVNVAGQVGRWSTSILGSVASGSGGR